MEFPHSAADLPKHDPERLSAIMAFYDISRGDVQCEALPPDAADYAVEPIVGIVGEVEPVILARAALRSLGWKLSGVCDAKSLRPVAKLRGY